MLYISGNSWLPCQHWKRASTANLLVRILGFAANSNLAATLNLAASTFHFHSLFIFAFMTVGSTHLSRPSIIRINLWARAWAFDWNLGEEKEHFCSGVADIIVELLCCPLPPTANSSELWIRAGPERCVWLTQINLGDVKPWRGVQPPLLFCR